ncbi:MAG: peptidoglycan bridge formation glycyltransferase FemA/FemB family protein [Urechidicola sp.]|nr:peptidoglycan bridge formation glycyltransferase FemA/FemB family protein [Urechidicola sp.]
MTHSTFDIITTKKDWDRALERIGDFDFYHTYDYHHIGLKAYQTPTLLKYSQDDFTIALPLLIQKIEGTSYYDATSVYGYAGPISTNLPNDFDNTEFIKRLKLYFENHHIIAVFSRLNPYINNQKSILNNYGNLTQQGSVVNIDITLNADIQRQNYQSRLKTHVNKSRRNCDIKKATSKDDVQEFIAIYYENMKRVNAEDSYFFDKNYFLEILNSTDFESEILLAIDKQTKQIIAGSMFITTNNIVQYHLSGCKNDFLHLMPIKLLIDEMRLIATQRKLHFLNLGGGLGSNNSDTLFRFKSSFSKDFKDFYLWKLIVNKTVYEGLVQNNNVKEDVSYFPKYRFLETAK